MNHYYIFYKKSANHDWFYERTAGTEKRAIERCNELEQDFYKAIFTVNELPNEKWFY